MYCLLQNGHGKVSSPVLSSSYGCGCKSAKSATSSGMTAFDAFDALVAFFLRPAGGIGEIERGDMAGDSIDPAVFGGTMSAGGGNGKDAAVG